MLFLRVDLATTTSHQISWPPTKGSGLLPEGAANAVASFGVETGRSWDFGIRRMAMQRETKRLELALVARAEPAQDHMDAQRDAFAQRQRRLDGPGQQPGNFRARENDPVHPVHLLLVRCAQWFSLSGKLVARRCESLQL